MLLINFLIQKKINQIIISNSIKNNNHEILKNINIESYKYKNNFDNTLFFGIYEINDYKKFYNHKGKKWIFWCGNDMNICHPPRLKNIKELLKNNNIMDHLYCNNLLAKNFKKLNINGIWISTHMLNNPKNHFTFIISSYNNCKWFERNLDSIKNQTYTKWNAIYVDDNSNDNTYDLVLNYINDNNLQNKIKLIKNDNNYKQGDRKSVV